MRRTESTRALLSGPVLGGGGGGAALGGSLWAGLGSGLAYGGDEALLDG